MAKAKINAVSLFPTTTVGDLTMVRRPYLNEYVGSAEALIAAKIVTQKQIPGQQGVRKYGATFYNGAMVKPRSRPPMDEGYVKIQRRGVNTFSVTVGISTDEIHRRYIAEELVREAKETVANEARSERELESMPKSHEQFRERRAKTLEGMLVAHIRFHMQPSQSHGFCFDEETIEEFEMLAEKLVCLVANGKTIYDAKRQSACIAEIQASAMEPDLSARALAACVIAQAARYKQVKTQ